MVDAPVSALALLCCMYSVSRCWLRVCSVKVWDGASIPERLELLS
jgi:hypothetical protein